MSTVGGIVSTPETTTMSVADIMSTPGVFRALGEYHQHTGGFSVLLMKMIQFR